jgi:hypothetical protein
MGQRGISRDALAACLRHGRVEHRHGLEFFHLGRKELEHLGMARQEKLEGVTAVVGEGVLLTAYRNKDAFATIRRKSKRGRRERFQANPRLFILESVG